jgi:hypothetical protein
VRGESVGDGGWDAKCRWCVGVRESRVIVHLETVESVLIL